jgi:hypothetical protein
MNKILFCLLALMCLSLSTFAKAPKYDLYKPYTPTRMQWLQSLLQDEVIKQNATDPDKIYSAVVVYPDKIHYDLLVHKDATYDDIKARKEYFTKITNIIKNSYVWAKELPMEFQETTTQ